VDLDILDATVHDSEYRRELTVKGQPFVWDDHESPIRPV
jgi:hypothetical protein